MQPNLSTASNGGDTPGLSEYFGIIRKRRKLLFTVGLPIALAATALALGLPDVYRSSGLIEIEQQARNPNQQMMPRGGEEEPYADKYVQSLSTIVLSDKNLRRMLSEHQLYDDQGEVDGGLVKQLRSDINVNIVTVPILDPDTGRERKVVSAFNVAYENRDPQRARDGAAWLVEAFLAQNRADRRGLAANAAQFYAAEAERMRQNVAAMESKLAEFKAKHSDSLPELNEVNRGSLDRAETDLRNVETQMQALRRERVFLMAQLQQARSAAPETANLRQLEEEYRRKSVSYDQSHPDMVALRRQIDTLRSGGSVSGMSLRSQLQQQRSILSEARQRYSDDHPDIKRIMRNIESLEARIASGENADSTLASDSPMAIQLQTQVNATDTQLAALEGRAAELRAKIGNLESRMATAPEVEREFQTVTRDLASARAKYDELLKRQMDAEVSESAIAGGTADKFRVAAAPSVPDRPAKPKRMAIIVVGLAFGLIAAMTAIIIAQLLDQTVRGARDVRDILDVTPLAAVPVIEPAKSRRRGRAAPLRWAAGTASVLALVLAGSYITTLLST